MISIIIPAYNAEKYILRCLESCVNQTYQDLEIIIIDDGSVDNTVKLCKTISDKRIKIITKDNAGVSEARNEGLCNAKGKYVLFLDADDFITKDCCETMVRTIEKEPDIDLVVCGYARINTNDEKQMVRPSETQVFDTQTHLLDAIEYLKKSNCLFTCWNKLYRKEKINFKFDKNMSFAEDSIFVFEYLSRCRRIVVINSVGYYYWIGTEVSAMKKFHNDMFRMIQKEYKKIIKCDSDSVGLSLFAFEHYIENVIYWCVPQLVADSKYTISQKKEMLGQIWQLDDFDKCIIRYTPQRKLHSIYKFLMKNKCSLILLLLFKLKS